MRRPGVNNSTRRFPAVMIVLVLLLCVFVSLVVPILAVFVFRHGFDLRIAKLR